MYKRTLILIYLLFSSFIVISQVNYHLPKVLIITSGADTGRGTVSDGVVVALQAFNRLGVFVRLENREALLQEELLAKYDILILPTIKGYHDKPQKYSLTFMSDMELENIARWVKNGGTLITDVNMGRNTPKGEDRIVKNGILNVNNWKLGRCFGTALKEIKISDFYIKDSNMKIWDNHIMNKKTKEKWSLVPVETSENVKILAKWQNEEKSFAAITLNKYGKGNAFLLPTFYILHPIKDGGLSTEKQIYSFYHLVFESYTGNRKYKIQLSPWKDAHTSAYCQTFDDGGNMEEYERIFKFTRINKLPTVFFVTPHIDKKVSKKLLKEPFISVQGHSYNHPDFRKLDYTETLTEFLMNRQYWNKNFSGFRFPYVSNSFWGMYLLDKLGFEYETSIAANHFEYIRGSVVPYNIPIFNNDFYTSLNLLEISQIYRSDWYFYQDVLNKEEYTTEHQKSDAERFRKYLIKYFDEIVKPNNGVMVYLGHPMYSGISSETLQPLQDLLNHLKNTNVWVASLNEVAHRWNKLSRMDVQVKETDNNVTITINLKGEKISGFTLVLGQKPVKVECNKDFNLKEKNNKYYLVFDLDDKETINLKY